jgi:2-dehydro-3-deoxyphosphooctonate aldolase (KDO 8-P synthase)
VDALFIEVHPNPAKAKSDGPNAWPLGKLDALWRMAMAADRVGRAWR